MQRLRRCRPQQIKRLKAEGATQGLLRQRACLPAWRRPSYSTPAHETSVRCCIWRRHAPLQALQLALTVCGCDTMRAATSLRMALTASKGRSSSSTRSSSVRAKRSRAVTRLRAARRAATSVGKPMRASCRVAWREVESKGGRQGWGGGWGWCNCASGGGTSWTEGSSYSEELGSAADLFSGGILPTRAHVEPVSSRCGKETISRRSSSPSFTRRLSIGGYRCADEGKHPGRPSYGA